MNKKQKSLIKLLNCAIKKENPLNINHKEINWSYIVSESQEHKIYPLLYPVIKDISQSGIISNSIKETWKRHTFSTAMDINNQIQQMSRVFKEFNLSNIPVIALKGLILRSLYPYPDLRTMGDADILIHEEDLERVTTCLMKMGYVQSKEATPAHIVFMHKYYTTIEVHWKLADTRYIKDVSQFENKVWEHAVIKTIGDIPILSLCTEDFLVHLCIHMAVHMKSGGFGLRQLCDLVLLVEKESSNITWETFTLKIRNNGIEKFTAAIFNVCNTLFNLQLPKEIKNISIDKKDISMLINDIFDSGVWGQKSINRIFGNNLLNADVILKERNSTKMRSVLHIICPPVNTLSNAYSYAKKYKILIPIAWIHHFFSGLFNNKYNILEKSNFLFFSTSTFKKRERLIKNLEL